MLLGVAVMTIDGKRTKAGGRVLKNVTGYDLNKLYIGSLGTLAIIFELTCKLHPLPPGELTLGIGCAGEADLAPMLQTILQLPLRLNSLELLNAAACETLATHAALSLVETGYMLIARVEGTPAVTQSQAQRLTELGCDHAQGYFFGRPAARPGCEGRSTYSRSASKTPILEAS